MINSTETTIQKERSSTESHDDLSGWTHSPFANAVGVPTFTDEFIAHDRGKDVFFKNCYHRKHELTTNMPTVQYTNFPGMEDGTHTRIRINPCNHMVHPIYGHAPLPNINSPSRVWDSVPDSVIDDLSVKALRHMLPRMEDISDGFNVGNFLAELRDIKQMFLLWKGSATFLNNVSSGVLNWELAWRPFIGDMNTLFNKVRHLQTYIDRWNDAAKKGTIYTRHSNVSNELTSTLGITNVDDPGTWTLSSIDGPHAPWTVNTSDDKHYHYRWYKYNEEASCFFHLYFRPQRIDYDNIIDMISIWFDVLGGGDGFSIVWEAVPFSFVVDWFYGVGDFLEQFEQDAFTVPYEIVDFGYSVKHVIKEGWSYRSDALGIQNRIHPKPGIYEYTDSVYTRRRIHPPIHRLDEWSFDPLLTFKIPSWKQVWVGLNLANVLRGKK